MRGDRKQSLHCGAAARNRRAELHLQSPLQSWFCAAPTLGFGFIPTFAENSRHTLRFRVNTKVGKTDCVVQVCFMLVGFLYFESLFFPGISLRILLLSGFLCTSFISFDSICCFYCCLIAVQQFHHSIKKKVCLSCVFTLKKEKKRMLQI